MPALCAVLGASASGFYAWLVHPASVYPMADQQHRAAMQTIQDMRGYGYVTRQL